MNLYDCFVAMKNGLNIQCWIRAENEDAARHAFLSKLLGMTVMPIPDISEYQADFVGGASTNEEGGGND